MPANDRIGDPRRAATILALRPLADAALAKAKKVNVGKVRIAGVRQPDPVTQDRGG